MMAVLMINRLIPLELMQSGESGCIHDVNGAADVVHRLSEMGLATGASVKMVRPGTPCILSSGENRLSVRVDPSLSILVSVAD